MTGQVNPDVSERISAYLDGALPKADRLALEAEMATNPVVRAEFDALSRVDAALADGFAEMLASPVPLHLARKIEYLRPEPDAIPVLQTTGSGLRSLAAGFALLAVGAAGGAFVTKVLAPPVEVAMVAPGWLDQVADYHAVYAAQGRHLVEVPATELSHLEKWLSETTGVPFKAPDLTASGLLFEGARLLVANGKPVAQLMYRDASGQVVAVCFMAGGDATAHGIVTAFADRRIGGFDLVSWKTQDAAFVVIGPADRPDLRKIAEAASIQL